MLSGEFFKTPFWAKFGPKWLELSPDVAQCYNSVHFGSSDVAGCCCYNFHFQKWFVVITRLILVAYCTFRVSGVGFVVVYLKGR